MTGFESLRGLTYAQASQGPQGGQSLRGMTYAQATAQPQSLRGMTYDQAVATEAPAGYTLSAIGVTAQIAGAVIGAIGAFASAQAQKDHLKSQAMNADHVSKMAAIDARQGEIDAQAIMEAGRHEIGRLTLAAGQAKSRLRVSAASRGVVGNVGSAAEVESSSDIVTSIDVSTINANTVRAAGQARARATNSRSQSLLAGVSAGNLRRTASTINPALAFNNSSLASGGQFAGRFARSR